MTRSATVVLASGNAGKLAEMRTLLEPLAMELVPQSDYGVGGVAESGLTFIENALIKARYAARLTGLPVLADDSGIAVDALGGRPGIYSARYAGAGGDAAANNAKLLQELADITDPAARGAHFRCVVVYLRAPDDPVPIVCEGVWSGRIAFAPRGSGGFGYDPLFEDPELGCTGGELDPAEKNRISHRGKALRALTERLNVER
ncbi:MAG: RdgB/HAM1 family non-canonical purine NTP pyrophosphatase [Pseudomonadota bacterium]